MRTKDRLKPHRGGLFLERRTVWQKFSDSPLLGLTLACVCCLAPFSGKAFCIDDPVFVWVAQHIQKHPADFYGFDINWYGGSERVADINKNPPLVSYYLCLIGSCVGWSEWALHLGMLAPATGAILGTYLLASRFTSRPVLAALGALLTPDFLVSASTVMSDTMMVCFWVWAVYFWDLGLERRQRKLLCVAGLLVAASALTKYFGVSLLGLLPAYAIAKRAPLRLWLPGLVLPVIALVSYQGYTNAIYGRGLLLDAATYASETRWQQPQVFDKMLIGLVFMGGCLASAVFYGPLLWSPRSWIVGGALALVALLLLTHSQSIGGHPLRIGEIYRWGLIFQLVLWCLAGVAILALSLDDFRRHWDPQALLLFLWIAGTLVFAIFLNWTTNARSLLPLTPVVGILLMRRIDRRYGRFAGQVRLRFAAPLLPAAVLALAVLWADDCQASSARAAAAAFQQQFANQPPTKWFQGHWGFQYYMASWGAIPLDVAASDCRRGDIIIFPINNNTNVIRMPDDALEPLGMFESPACRWLSTQNPTAGGGFYSDLFGPLPFVFAEIPPDVYFSLRFVREVRVRRAP